MSRFQSIVANFDDCWKKRHEYETHCYGHHVNHFIDKNANFIGRAVCMHHVPLRYEKAENHAH